MRTREAELRWSEKSRERLRAIEREVGQLRGRLSELTEQYPLDRRDPGVSSAGSLVRGRIPEDVLPVPEASGLSIRDRPYAPADERERERFAHYLASADLARTAPQLRRERIAHRNRAIVMAILALFLVVAVVLLYLRHRG